MLDFSPVERACYDIIFSHVQGRASGILKRLPKRCGVRYHHGFLSDDDTSGSDGGDGGDFGDFGDFPQRKKKKKKKKPTKGTIDLLALLVRLRQACITSLTLPKWLRIVEVRACARACACVPACPDNNALRAHRARAARAGAFFFPSFFPRMGGFG
jgi:hypothetical protein